MDFGTEFQTIPFGAAFKERWVRTELLRATRSAWEPEVAVNTFLRTILQGVGQDSYANFPVYQHYMYGSPRITAWEYSLCPSDPRIALCKMIPDSDKLWGKWLGHLYAPIVINQWTAKGYGYHSVMTLRPGVLDAARLSKMLGLSYQMPSEAYEFVIPELGMSAEDIATAVSECLSPEFLPQPVAA